MNCSDAEQLFDAYLDGQLTGSLRLELDAHRLRCRRCQQTLAMMEACEHVLTADRGVPALAEDFTERVMTGIERNRFAPRRWRGTRVAVTVGFVLQAAAVLILAIIFQSQPTKQPVEPGPARVGPTEGLAAVDEGPADQGVSFADLFGTPRTAGASMLAAMTGPMNDIERVAEYLNDIGASEGPFGGIWSGPSEESSAPPASSDRYSL